MKVDPYRFRLDPVVCMKPDEFSERILSTQLLFEVQTFLHNVTARSEKYLNILMSGTTFLILCKHNIISYNEGKDSKPIALIEGIEVLVYNKLNIYEVQLEERV